MEPTHIFQDVSLCERFQACPASSNQLKEIWRVKRKEKQKRGKIKAETGLVLDLFQFLDDWKPSLTKTGLISHQAQI